MESEAQGRSARTPNCRISGLQRAVGNDRDRPAERVDADIAVPDIRQILDRHAGLQARHALQPGIGPDPVQAKQQALLQHRALQHFVSGRTFQHIGANRYRNPDEDLPADFEANRDEYYKALNLPLDADRFITEFLAAQLFTQGLQKTMSRTTPSG